MLGLKNSAKCLCRGSLNVGLSAYICAVTFMTEISSTVTNFLKHEINKIFHFSANVAFAYSNQSDHTMNA